MAIGSIELATIARTQDFTTIKHNEDAKGTVMQVTAQTQGEKEINQRTRQVNDTEGVIYHRSNPDAKEKGNGTYAGDGGRNRRKGPDGDGQVIPKQGGPYSGGFDVKI